MTTNIILKNDPFIYDLASFIMSFAFSEVNSLLSIQKKNALTIIIMIVIYSCNGANKN